eukprot:2634909-Rhodomonas_salina.1
MLRRPTAVLKQGTDPRRHVGTFWELEDFQGIRKDFFDLLTETKALEEITFDHVRRHNTFSIEEEKIREWIDCVSFAFDEELQHYAEPPYANLGETLDVFKMAVSEVNRNLKAGKILPLK